MLQEFRQIYKSIFFAWNTKVHAINNTIKIKRQYVITDI